MITDDIFKIIITLLFLLLLLISTVLYMVCCGTARVYNWNGKRYCYLGYVPIRRRDGAFVLHISERMVELSHTTRYRICPGRIFCRKNRYRDMYVYADGSSNHLVVERGAMKTEIPF